MHGGFVGPGMLDAACPREIFTSPTPDQMLEATKVVDGLYHGRRDVGVTVLAEKICGVAAEDRRSLAEVAGVPELVELVERLMGPIIEDLPFCAGDPCWRS
jgi:dihydroxyacetone kinase-like protein